MDALFYSNGYMLAKESFFFFFFFFFFISFSRAQMYFSPTLWRRYENFNVARGGTLPENLNCARFDFVFTFAIETEYWLQNFFSPITWCYVICNFSIWGHSSRLDFFDVTVTISKNILILASNTSQMSGLANFNINDWKYLVFWKEWSKYVLRF